MRQHRPTSLVLAVSLALFAHVAIAQTSTRAAASPARSTLVVVPNGGNPGPQVVPGAALAPPGVKILVDTNGNLLVDGKGNAFVSDGRGLYGLAPIDNGVVVGVDPGAVEVVDLDSTTTTLSPARTSPELDRLTRKQQQKEKSAARSDRQLVQSIVPRTGQDRTDQMRDDPIGPRY